AAGNFPVRAVEAMARICMGAERQFAHDTDFEKAQRGLEHADQAIAMATMFISEHIGVAAIVAMTESGGTARHLSRFRAGPPIYAFSRHAGARRRMALMRDEIGRASCRERAESAGVGGSVHKQGRKSDERA